MARVDASQKLKPVTFSIVIPRENVRGARKTYLWFQGFGGTINERIVICETYSVLNVGCVVLQRVVASGFCFDPKI